MNDFNITHELKTLPMYFDPILSGEKTFEIRKDDRFFLVGDRLLLREYDVFEYTGRVLTVEVTYITAYAQQLGYVVMGIRPV